MKNDLSVKKTDYYLTIYFLLILGYLFSRGFYSLPGLVIVFLCFLLINFLPKFIVEKEDNLYLFYLLIFSISLGLFFNYGIYEKYPLITNFHKYLLLFSLPVAVLYFKQSNKSKNKGFKNKKKILFLSLIAILIRVLIILASPQPAIDAFYILKEAPSALISGKNPYEITYYQVYQGYPANYYTYWPGSFLATLPFVLLFNEPRVLFIISELLTAYLIYLLGRKTLRAEFTALLFLFNPVSLFIIEQSWLTPLHTFLITLTFYLLSQRRINKIFLGIISGLLISLQFYLLLIIPLLGKHLNFSKKYLLAFIFLCFLVIFPFFIWSPNDFIRDTFKVYFSNPPIAYIPTQYSLNLNGFLHNISGRNLPFIFSVIPIFSIFIFNFLKLKKQDKGDLLRRIIISFMGLFLFGQQAFINYYYFIGNLLLVLSII